MMLQDGSSATPSDLQAAILKGLLAGASKPSEADIDLVAPAKLLLPALQKVLGADRVITVLSQHAITLSECWKSQSEPCVPFVFAMDEEGGSPSLILMPRGLITSLMTIALGGQISSTKPTNYLPLSPVETRFAKRLAPQLKDVISPFLNAVIKQVSTVAEDENAFIETLPETPVHALNYSIELGEIQYEFAVAVARSALALLSMNDSKAPAAPSKKHDVAGEIGRTQICVEVLFKLGEQTLQRLDSLTAGDVITIAGANFSEAKLRVRGHDLFEGHIGRSGQSYSFKVARPTRKQTGGMSQMVKTLTERGQNR